MNKINNSIDSFGLVGMKNVHSFTKEELDKVRELCDWYNGYRGRVVVGLYMFDGVHTLARTNDSGNLRDFWVLFNKECNFDKEKVVIHFVTHKGMWCDEALRTLNLLSKYGVTFKHENVDDSVSFNVYVNRYTNNFDRVYTLIKSL